MGKVAHIGGFQLFNYLEFRKDPVTFLYRMHEVADFATINPNAKAPSYIVHLPDAVKEILTTKDEKFKKGSSAETFSKTLGNGVLTSEGEAHRRQRKMLQPAFHKRRIASYADVVVEYAGDLVRSWHDGETRLTSQDMMDVTLRIIAKTMLGTDIQAQSKEITQAVNDIIERTASKLLSPFTMPDIFPTKQIRKSKEGVRTLDALADQLIESAQDSREDHLLAMLLQTTYEDGSSLPRQEIRDQIITMIIAGHETTANLLSWIWYVLSQHPEAEEAFHRELDDVLGEREPRFEDVPHLIYTNQIVQEVMRLYPPAWIILREAKEDVEITGHMFKKGSIFLISPYAIHRNPNYFEDSHSFKPERFTKENQHMIPNYAYFPFGAGSRGCIGSQFAMMEAMLIMAVIGQRYKLRLADENGAVETEPLVSLRIKNGLRMKLVKR